MKWHKELRKQVQGLFIAHLLWFARNCAEILRKRRRVISGAWDKSQTSFKPIILVWRAVKLYVKRTLIILLSRKLRLSNKFSIFGVISSIFFVSLIEIFKLSIGHESSRS
jgi:hypothetical protein